MQVMFGTTDGQVIVMSVVGLPLAQVSVSQGSDIVSMAWSCNKFELAEDKTPASPLSSTQDEGLYTLLLSLCYVFVVLYFWYVYIKI